MSDRSWIDEPDDQATDKLSRITKHWRDQGRRTPSVIGVMKISPNTLVGVNRMNQAVTFGGSVLGRRREELIAAAKIDGAGVWRTLWVVGLPLGAEFLIEGARGIARNFGVSEAAIGLTVVAVGTSRTTV